MKKILFVIRSLELGGITTSLINLLEHIEETAKDEFDIDVLTFAQNSGANLPDYVKVLNTTKNLKLLRYICFNFISKVITINQI